MRSSELCVFILAALCASLCAGGRARSLDEFAEHPWQGALGLQLITAAPFGDGQWPSDWGYGLGFQFGVRWKPLPLTLGMDFLLAHWGASESKHTLDLGDQIVSATITRTDFTVFYDVWLRLRSTAGHIAPYVEGVIGLKGLFSEYALEIDGGSGRSDAQGDSLLASSLGVGAGLEMLLATNDGGARAYVTLGFRWLRGSHATFQVTDARGAMRDVELSTTTTLIVVGISATTNIFEPEGEP